MIETVKRTPDSEPESVWCFGAYANDFIKMNGVWKIWHLRWFLTSKCPYTEGWADQRTFFNGVRPEPTEDRYYNPYTKDYIQEAIPMGPLPYETWNEERWYMRQEKRP